MLEISFALSLTETGYPRRKARSRRSAFARFTRYSASDIAPAIATAVAPSREKIFWTTLDPTKNPFEARLSAARTTPSLLRMPTVVVMLNLGPLWGRSGKLIRVPGTRSQVGGTVAREDVIQDGPGTVLRGDGGPIHAAPLGSHRHRIEVVQADALQPQGGIRDPARIRDLGRNRDRLADVAVGREDLHDGRRGGVKHRVHQRISVLGGPVDQIGRIPETVRTVAQILGRPAALIQPGIVGPMVSAARIRRMPRIHAGLGVVRLKFVREKVVMVHLETKGRGQGQTASLTRNRVTVSGEPVPHDRTVGRSFEGRPNPTVRRNVVIGEGEIGRGSDDEQPVRSAPRDGVVIDDRVVRSVEQDSSARIRNIVPLDPDGVSGVGVDALFLSDAIPLDRDER